MVKKIFKKSPIYDKDKLLLALDVYLSELYAVEDYLEIGRIMELKKEILDDNQKNVHTTINVKQSTKARLTTTLPTINIPRFPSPSASARISLANRSNSVVE